MPPLARYPRHERMRVGYFSADLRNHAVAALTAELFETHDRSRFELTAFSLGADVRDGLRARIEPAFDRFLAVGGQSDHEVAELARRLEIDIAVDLGGYTGDARPLHPGAACGSRAGELSRLPRHLGRGLHGLSARRPGHHTGGGARPLRGKDRLSAELPSQRLEAAPSRTGASRGPSSACRRADSCSAASTRAGRSLPIPSRAG